MLFSVVFAVAVVSVISRGVHSGVRNEYKPYYLYAPFTSFDQNLSLNVSNIPRQLALADRFGVNLVWINGGLGQFQALTLDERENIAEEYLREMKKYPDMESLVHITDLNVENARRLGKHAKTIGADHVALLPPYYQQPGGNADIIKWMKTVTEGVCDGMGVFYYHIPGQSGVEIDDISDLVIRADAEIPNFQGVKFVDSHDKIWNFVKALEYKDGKYAKGMLWALEPKLAAFPFGARSIVLAEVFYAQYYNRLTEYWDNGELQKAYELQKFIQELHEVALIGGGKNVLRGFGFDLGGDRQPSTPHSESEITDMLSKLTGMGLFDQ